MSIKINGDSMIPFLKPTAEVKFKSVSAHSIQTGDVIAFYEKSSHIMVIHRVVRKVKKGYLVKGDNNWHTDPIIISANEILVLKEVLYKNKVWKTDTRIGRVVNKLFWGLSIIRFFPLIHRRRFQRKIIGG